MLHIFRHSRMDGNSFGIFNQKDLEMFAGSSTDLLTFLTYLCYLLASWYLEVPVRSSRQRKEESSFVAAHGTQQTRGLDLPSKSGLFLAAPPQKIYIVWHPPKIDLVDVANNDDFFFFRLISKGVGRWRSRRRVWKAGILWVESRRNLFATSESWEGTSPLFGFPRKTWEEIGGFCWVLSGDTYNFNKRTHVNWG